MQIIIDKGRLSYPALFEPRDFQGDENYKYSASILVPASDKKTIKYVNKTIQAFLEQEGKKVKRDKWCFTELEYDEDDEQDPTMGLGEGTMRFRMSSRADSKPVVCNEDREELLTEDLDVIYPGCWVQAYGMLWLQDNNWGTRVNCNIVGVIKVEDDERFGGGMSHSDKTDMMGVKSSAKKKRTKKQKKADNSTL